jgi:hypothetical protein
MAWDAGAMTTDSRQAPPPTVFAEPLPQPADTDMKFADMSRVQKGVYLTKLAICIATFGFAFPHV